MVYDEGTHPGVETRPDCPTDLALGTWTPPVCQFLPPPGFPAPLPTLLNFLLRQKKVCCSTQNSASVHISSHFRFLLSAQLRPGGVLRFVSPHIRRMGPLLSLSGGATPPSWVPYLCGYI